MSPFGDVGANNKRKRKGHTMPDPIDRKTPENLHKIMEVLEAVHARNKELEKKSERVDELSGALATLQARCDKLDKELPKGEKIFRAAGPASRDEALYNFGRCITESWRLRQYGKTSPEFQEFIRAAGSDATKAQQEGATDLGGVLVPVVTYNQVARIIGEASIIRKIATIIPMSTNTMTMPTRSSGPTVSWPGELTAPTSHSSVLFGNPQLVSKTMLAISEVSSELDEDSIVALEPFFATLFAEACAQEENKQAFYSTTPFTGLQATSGIGAVTFGASPGNTFAEISHADLVKLMFAVDSKLVHKGTFIMHATAFQQIVSLKDSQNRPIYATSWSALPSAAGVPEQTTAASTILMGRPCYLTDVMPSTAGAQNSQVFALYGDFSKFAFGDRRALTVEWSDQPFFENGNLALRVRERVAFKPLIASAFAKITSKA